MIKVSSILWGIMLSLPCLVQHAQAQQCYSQSSGNANQTSRWLCDGVSRFPTCGDTIHIASGHDVSITNQYDFRSCSSPMLLNVVGTLSFTNGNKLELPCNSVLSVQSSGVIRKTTSGGGNSTLISICNTTVWNASSGTLNGPTSYGGPVLPVELIAFNAVQVDGQASIAWSTATETNNDYFTLYYREDGEEWVELYQLLGAGNSTRTVDYSFEPNQTFSPGTLFRLDQTDIDGTTETVAMEALIISDEGDPSISTFIYPNPASVVTNIVFDPVFDQPTLRIYNSYGNLELDMGPIDGPTTVLDFSTLGLSPGTHLIEVVEGQHQQMLKLTIL